MSIHECPVPECATEDPTVSVFVNNSTFESEKGIDETDLTFDVSFPGPQVEADHGTSIHICEDCWNGRRHIKN
jgi:hypothetical protein